MDVSLFGRRVLFALLAISSLGFISCGNRYDLATEHGRRARIDDANIHLSKGECSAADEAINPLYASPYVDDEVRIVKASAQACYAGFSLFRFAANMASTSNIFQALAKSLDDNAVGRTKLYAAVDVLTQSGVVMNSVQRSRAVNTFMVFLNFGVISAIQRVYGAPSSTGAQGAAISYPGGMSNVDGCAFAGAFSFITDSYAISDLNDSTTQGAISSLNTVCTTATGGNCNLINRDRTICDGANAASTAAGNVVGGVDAAW